MAMLRSLGWCRSTWLVLRRSCVKLALRLWKVLIIFGSRVICGGVLILRRSLIPAFPTDLQSPMMAFLTIAAGTSVITETIFENRFKHVCELLRMGANIKVDGRTAVVRGVPKLTAPDQSMSRQVLSIEASTSPMPTTALSQGV